jgi:phosphatidate cytidylyltransferase
MSHLQQNKSSVASRTAFDVLTVEEGEQSEDEVVWEPEAVDSSVVCVELSSHHSYLLELNFIYGRRETPSRPSKTAVKKAAKAARQEKKLQNRVPPSGGDTYERLSPAPVVPLTATEPRLPAPSDRSSAEPRNELAGPLPPKTNANSQRRDEAPSSVLNGYSTKASESAPRSTPPKELPNPPSIPQHAADQPSTQSLPPSSPAKQAPAPSDSVQSSSNNVKRLNASTSLASGTDAEADKAAKKGHNIFVRTLWTFIMLGGFLGQLRTLNRATQRSNYALFQAAYSWVTFALSSLYFFVRLLCIVRSLDCLRSWIQNPWIMEARIHGVRH